jgi:hypothetical protein
MKIPHRPPLTKGGWGDFEVIFYIFVVFFFVFVSSPQAADLYTFVDEEGGTYYTNIPGNGRVKVVPPLKKARPKPPSSSFVKNHGKETYEPVITAASDRFAVDADLIWAVIKAESNFNHRAISPKGAMGLMQLMPETAKAMAVANPFDPAENVHAGVRYLSDLLKLLEGNLPLALAAYNAGPERVIGRNAIPTILETRNYVRRVMATYQNLKKIDFGP